MKIWIVSDTHFNHKKMVEEWKLRPVNFEEQIQGSLAQIPEEDVLIHLGDICIGKDEEMHQKYIAPLKCKKWLVRGNHDNKSDGWYLSHGWDFVAGSIVNLYFGKNIIFSHIPRDISLNEEIDLNIHGHLHDDKHRVQERIDDGKHLLCSLELQGYTAKTLDSFIHKIHKKS